MNTLKYLVGAIVAFGMFAASSAFAADDVSTTPHNLATGVEEICVYCHTPHNANASPAPLWNRTMLVTTFDMYSSPTIDMAIATDPNGVSLACLSCHDGVTAYDSVTNVGTGVTNNSNMSLGTPGYAVGSDGLGNDHPISITYDTGADAAFVTANSGTVGGTLPLYGVGKDQVECATCHNPHESTNVKFLRTTNDSSTLCTTCHIK